MSSKPLLKNPYSLINLILAGIILIIFLYSGLFSARKDNHPIPSFYEKITGESTASSGLSRSFSEIVRGNFKSARQYNENGILIFIFFLVQLVQRAVVNILLRKQLIVIKWLIGIDTVLSIGLFLFCFRNLIAVYLHTVT